MKRIRGWVARHRYTTQLVAAVAASLAAGFGELITGYPQHAFTAGFFMFSGMIFGLTLGDRLSR